MNAWICVRTEPHREAFAEANLRRTGLEVYCPRHQRWVSHARRKQLVLRPLFPGYLFARSPERTAHLGLINRTPGVISAAGKDLASAIVPDSIIAGLRESEGQNGFAEINSDRFKRGDLVRVSSGPLAGLEAIFSEREDERRCRILLGLLGKQHSLVVPSQILDSAA